MEEKLFFGGFKKIVNTWMQFLHPFVGDNGPRKLSRLFLFSFAVHLEWILVMALFIPSKFATSEWSEFTENLGVLISVTRACLYHPLLLFSADKMRLLIQRIISERDSVREDGKMWQMTWRQCKLEFLMSIGFVLGAQVAVTIASLFPLFKKYNEYRLPFNFYIVCFPVDVSPLNWLINYLNQVCYCNIVGPMITIYFTVTLLLMNHSCWGLDMLKLTVEKLHDSSEDHDRSKQTDVAAITAQLKKIVERSTEVIDWLRKVQDLLKFSFMLEFSILSFVFCTFIFSLVLDPFGPAIIYLSLPILLSQLYIYCWMGKRISDRVDEVAEAIYDLNWTAMGVSHRKDVLLVLVMMQNVQGFNGIFNEVNMPTFHSIMEFTYTLITFLKSTM